MRTRLLLGAGLAILTTAVGFWLAFLHAQSSLEPADLVFVNGVVYTVDEAHPHAQAIAVRGERIIAVGSNTEIQPFIGNETRVVDLAGRFLMPGFNDAHVHMGSAGSTLMAIDLRGVTSIAEMQQRIRQRLNRFQPGEWVTGANWDHTLWRDQRWPNKHDLDAVSRAHPMFFGRVDGHSAVANSRALELAGITRATANPPGGEIDRDPKSGEPTGVLKENANELVTRKIAPLTMEQRRRALELALADAARWGVTSLQDNSAWDDFLAFGELKKEGKLSARVTEWLPFLASVERLKQMQKEGGTSDPWLRTGALKAITDGSGGSHTAAMLEPFSDKPGDLGILRIPADKLREMVVERDRAGFQIALHAIGDRANRASLEAFAAARQANGARDARHRIEHAQFVALSDFRRFKQLDVIASMQPCHLLTDVRWAQKLLGPERSKGAYAWNSMLQQGVRLAFGTDYDVEPINPMLGLYAAVTRENEQGEPRGGWFSEEKISIDEAIRAYTLGSAYAEFAEKYKGSITPGKWADVVVLSRNITRATPKEILSTEVLMTVVGGRVVYEKR